MSKRYLVERFVRQTVIPEIFEGGNVRNAGDQFRVAELQGAVEAEIETSAFYVLSERVAIAFIAKRDTRATCDDSLRLFDHIEAHTYSGDVVEFDVLHAIEAAFI